MTVVAVVAPAPLTNVHPFSFLEVAYEQKDFALIHAFLSLTLSRHHIEAVAQKAVVLQADLLEQMHSQLLSANLLDFYRILKKHIEIMEQQVEDVGAISAFNKAVGLAHAEIMENCVEEHFLTLNGEPFLHINTIKTPEEEDRAFAQIMTYKRFLIAQKMEAEQAVQSAAAPPETQEEADTQEDKKVEAAEKMQQVVEAQEKFWNSIESTVVEYYRSDRILLTPAERAQAATHSDTALNRDKREKVIFTLKLIRNALTAEAHNSLAKESDNSKEAEKQNKKTRKKGVSAEQSKYQFFKETAELKLENLVKDQEQKTRNEHMLREKSELLKKEEGKLNQKAEHDKAEMLDLWRQKPQQEKQIYQQILFETEEIDVEVFFQNLIEKQILLTDKHEISQNTLLHYAVALFSQSEKEKAEAQEQKNAKENVTEKVKAQEAIQERLAGVIRELILKTGFLNEKNKDGQTPISCAEIDIQNEGTRDFNWYLELTRLQNVYLAQKQREPNYTPDHVRQAFLAASTKNYTLASVLFGAITPYEEKAALQQAEIAYWEKALEKKVVDLLINLYDHYHQALEENNSLENVDSPGSEQAATNAAKEARLEKMKSLAVHFHAYRDVHIKETLLEIEKCLTEELTDPSLRPKLQQAVSIALSEIRELPIPAPTHQGLLDESKKDAELLGVAARQRQIKEDKRREKNKEKRFLAPWDYTPQEWWAFTDAKKSSYKQKRFSAPWSYMPQELLAFINKQKSSYKQKRFELERKVLDLKLALNNAFEYAQTSREAARRKALKTYFKEKEVANLYRPGAISEFALPDRRKNTQRSQLEAYERVGRRQPETEVLAVPRMGINFILPSRREPLLINNSEVRAGGAADAAPAELDGAPASEPESDAEAEERESVTDDNAPVEPDGTPASEPESDTEAEERESVTDNNVPAEPDGAPASEPESDTEAEERESVTDNNVPAEPDGAPASEPESDTEAEERESVTDDNVPAEPDEAPVLEQAPEAAAPANIAAVVTHTRSTGLENHSEQPPNNATQEWEALLSVRVPQDITDQSGNSFLHRAALSGCVRMAALCVTHGADFNLLNAENKRPYEVGVFQDKGNSARGESFKMAAVSMANRGSILQQVALAFYEQECRFLELLKKAAETPYSFNFLAKKEEEERKPHTAVVVIEPKKQEEALSGWHYTGLMLKQIKQKVINDYEEVLATLKSFIDEARRALDDTTLLAYLDDFQDHASENWAITLRRCDQLLEFGLLVKSVKSNAYGVLQPRAEIIYLSDPQADNSERMRDLEDENKMLREENDKLNGRTQTTRDNEVRVADQNSDLPSQTSEDGANEVQENNEDAEQPGPASARYPRFTPAQAGSDRQNNVLPEGGRVSGQTNVTVPSRLTV